MSRAKKFLTAALIFLVLFTMVACNSPDEQGGSGGENQAENQGSENGGGETGADSLLGKWEILGWNVDADGSWAPLEAPQYYTFDGETMEYDTGSEVMTTAYVVEGTDLQLTDWELTWPISWDEEGQLLLGDDRYAITYVCKKVEGE